VASFFKDAGAKVALFFSVNVWLAQGVKTKRLAIKKQRLYNGVMEGTLPIGVGAAVAISFIILVFILT
jgi:multicomponent Na+:H+ antiporter subunit D